MRMSDEAATKAAQVMADDGDLAWELRQRARGYGQPFRAILLKAADMLPRGTP